MIDIRCFGGCPRNCRRLGVCRSAALFPTSSVGLYAADGNVTCYGGNIAARAAYSEPDRRRSVGHALVLWLMGASLYAIASPEPAL